MRQYAEQEIRFADEDSFNDQSDTSLDYLMPVLSSAPGFVSGRTNDGSLQSKPFKTRPGYRLPRGPGQFSFDMWSCGAGADTATGALAHTAQTRLLSHGLGGEDLTQVGGVAGASATAGSMPNRTGTGLRGGICRVGQAGDGRCEGQATVMGNPTTDLLTELPDVPDAADVIRAAIMLYPKATLGATKRFLCAFAGTTGMQFLFTGCQLAILGIRIREGEPTRYTFTYNYAYWREFTVATPSGATMEDCDAQNCSGGSWLLQNVGTGTRPTNAENEIAELDITLNLGLAAKPGVTPGLKDCIVGGWVRTKPPGQPAGTLRLVHPYDADLLASWDKDGSDSDAFHFLATLNVGGGTAATEGRSDAIYVPNMFRSGPRMPPFELNGLQYQESMFDLTDGPDNTNELTESFIRIAKS